MVSLFIIGSCLSYGHSCWGAHGKRSSNDRTEPEPLQDRWALFKVNQDEVHIQFFSLNPIDFYYLCTCVRFGDGVCLNNFK